MLHKVWHYLRYLVSKCFRLALKDESSEYPESHAGASAQPRACELGQGVCERCKHWRKPETEHLNNKPPNKLSNTLARSMTIPYDLHF